MTEPRRNRGCLKPIKWGCAGVLLVFIGLVAALLAVLHRVPKTYPLVANPIEPPGTEHAPGGGLDGFSSPYLGHTGSWDGRGGAMGGRSKENDLDEEVRMGLRWTFVPVYWRKLEPNGPVDLSKDVPSPWRSLDAFVLAAHQRKLNVLMQAPVIGGNAGGPPTWAGRREPGKSAPVNMEAAAEFAQKLAARYAPGGSLAQQQGWQTNYGVRAWELDNEPDGYLTHWKGQAADYAEFVTRSAAAIRKIDPAAVIIGPSIMGGGRGPLWAEGALDAEAKRGSPSFRQTNKPYSIGPVLDVVSFHIYEGLDSAFSGSDRTVEVAFSEIRELFERWENRSTGFKYSQKKEYWQTEGNFDFFGILSQKRRAAWRIQFLTRAFAAGIRKVMVMDASPPEQIAVRTYVETLPNPFPMQPATDQVKVLRGTPVVFCHQDNSSADAGRVWVLWAAANTGDAELDLTCIRDSLTVIGVDGSRTEISSKRQHVRVPLTGDDKMAAPLMLIDRPAH